eukprot:4444257-Alexandrium_andersonii.AAC.2
MSLHLLAMPSSKTPKTHWETGPDRQTRSQRLPRGGFRTIDRAKSESASERETRRVRSLDVGRSHTSIRSPPIHNQRNPCVLARVRRKTPQVRW